MISERLILCGGTRAPAGADTSFEPIRLDLLGDAPNMELKVQDISSKLLKEIPAHLIDLLEIATYVYCADQAWTRGGDTLVGNGSKWRRKFHLHIPVREPDRWNSSGLKGHLQDVLGFLSDDDFQFTFSDLKRDRSGERYFEFGQDAEKGFVPEDVVLFSGGLDSLAGAVKETIEDKRKIVLVTHRSNPKIVSRQKDLMTKLSTAAPGQVFYVPVWVKKQKEIGKEYTQRSRSFLYASLGAVVAKLFGLNRIRFYENGPISINLPVTPHVLGGRATRTTHPQVLNGFSRLFSSVFESHFGVENPFIWKTKSEIVKKIIDCGQQDLIKHSVSCAHTWEMTRIHTHCGHCSQCIDRRFAILASGAAEYDPPEMYAADLLTGPRMDHDEVTMVEEYARTTMSVKQMDETQFFNKFGEATRVLRHLPGTTDQVAAKVIDLYKRHSGDVCAVIDSALKEHASDLREGTLPETCLVALSVNKRYKQTATTNKKSLAKNGFQLKSWAELRIKFKDGHNVSVSIDGTSKVLSYEELGFVDRRKSAPDAQWQLLHDFADGHGVFTWDHPKADRRQQKRREKLSAALMGYFGLPDDPIDFVRETKGWKTRFSLEPEGDQTYTSE